MSIKSMILADTWDSGGQNGRFAAASKRHGKDLHSLIMNDGQDLAGISARFAAAAKRSRGHLVIRAAHRQQTYLDYPYDLRWKPDTEPEIQRLADAADVIHLNDRIYGYLHFKQEGKPALLHHHGSAFRGHSKQLSADARKHNMVETVSTVDLLRYGGPDLTWLPAPYHAPTLAAIREEHRRPEDGRVRVVQTPTNRAVKSTSKLEEAVRMLQDEGLPVDLVVGEQISNSQALETKAAADIFFDQVQLGYGCSAIEAWGMGLPVIAGGDDWTEARMRVEFGSDDLPFYKASDTVESIHAAVRALVVDEDLRAGYAARGAAHFAKFHDERQSLKRLVKLYLLAMDPERVSAKPVELPGSFRNTKYPALMFYADGIKFKFAGGRLRVSDGPTAELVRLHALASPQAGIVEEEAIVAPA